MENTTFAEQKIMETANSFKKLYYIYKDREEDNVFGEQMLETARLLEDIIDKNKEIEHIGKESEAKIRKILKQNNIYMDKIRINRSRDNHLQLMVRAKTLKRQYVSVANMAEFLSIFFEKPLIPLDGGRKFITNNMAEFLIEETPKYFTMTGVKALSKNIADISGDAYSCINNQGGKSMVCICDGMGTGINAARTSGKVVDMLEQFFEAGFSEKTSVRMVNAAMVTRCEENPFTLDLGVFDLYKGSYSVMKFGSMASYIKRASGVEIVRPSSLPAGLLENAVPDTGEYPVSEGEYVIMVSDGVVDALPFYDKEQQMANIVEALPFGNPNLMAEKIMEEIFFYLGEEYKDDMTVVVTGIWRH